MSETSSSNSDQLLQQQQLHLCKFPELHLCKFPDGLKVLVLETDTRYLQELAQLLQTFHYEVTKCAGADEALGFLKDENVKFDILVADFDTIDMNGFEFLGLAAMASSLPIVVFSVNRDPNYIKEGLVRGASALFGKPLSIEAMDMLWHIVVRQKYLSRTSSSMESEITTNRQKTAETKHAATNNHATSKPKPRFAWTKEVEALFVESVNRLGGPDSAVPKRIHEYMIERGMKGLNSRHISSHLQKYRGDVKLLQQQQQEQQQSTLFAQQMDCSSVSFPMLNNNNSLVPNKYLSYNTSNPYPSVLSGFYNHNSAVSSVGSYSSQTEVLQGPSSGYLASAFLNHPNNGGTSSYPKTMLSQINPNPNPNPNPSLNPNSNNGAEFQNQNRSVISHLSDYHGVLLSANNHHLSADYPMIMEHVIDDHLPFQEQQFLVNSDVVALTDATFYNDYKEEVNLSIDDQISGTRFIQR